MPPIPRKNSARLFTPPYNDDVKNAESKIERFAASVVAVLAMTVSVVSAFKDRLGGWLLHSYSLCSRFMFLTAKQFF